MSGSQRLVDDLATTVDSMNLLQMSGHERLLNDLATKRMHPDAKEAVLDRARLKLYWNGYFGADQLRADLASMPGYEDMAEKAKNGYYQ